MAEEKRTPSKGRKRRKRERSMLSRIAGAFLFLIFVLGSAAVLATVGWSWANDLLALNKEYTSTILTVDEDMLITKTAEDEEGNPYTYTGADMGPIIDQLEEDGLIQYKFLFKLYAWFSKADRKISAGTYELNTTMDYRALVTNMGKSSSTRQTVDVTIPEGYTVDQIFQLLEDNGVSTVEKLEDMAANWPYKWSFLQEIPLGDHRRLEGYLFPDTYTFYQGEDPKYVINKILLRFDQQMDEYYKLFKADEEGNTQSPYTLHEIVILASMIEKETDGEDYKKISSVLRNRLNNPTAQTAGFLQIDATLVYINGGRIPTFEDKEIDSPYNPYKYKGLPAGPISNPGMASLYAAMNPEKTNYFFYALNPTTGRHEFSRTFEEHQNKLASYNHG